MTCPLITGRSRRSFLIYNSSFTCLPKRPCTAARARKPRNPRNTRHPRNMLKCQVHSLIGIDALVRAHHGPKLPRATHFYSRPRLTTWMAASFVHRQSDMNSGPRNAMISFFLLPNFLACACSPEQSDSPFLLQHTAVDCPF